jgi:hypothetical protein
MTNHCTEVSKQLREAQPKGGRMVVNVQEFQVLLGKSHEIGVPQFVELE